MKTKPQRAGQAIHILLAGCRAIDQTLLQQWVLSQRLPFQLSCVSTVEQTLTHLETSFLEYYNFPRLLLADLQLAPRADVWPVIEQLKARYRWLPLVLISSDEHLETIRLAYQVGINAVVSRSADAGQWQQQLEDLAYYWLKLTALPRWPPADSP